MNTKKEHNTLYVFPGFYIVEVKLTRFLHTKQVVSVDLVMCEPNISIILSMTFVVYLIFARITSIMYLSNSKV